MDCRSFSVLLLICLTSLGYAAQGSTATSTAKLENSKSCFRGVFSSYESWLNTLKSNKKNFSEEAFSRVFPKTKYEQRRQNLECVDFTYQSDGFEVEGYYVKPKDAQGKLPVVIFNRGGNGSYGYAIFPV